MADLLQAGSFAPVAAMLVLGAVVGSLMTLIVTRYRALRGREQLTDSWVSDSPEEQAWFNDRLKDQISYYNNSAAWASRKYHFSRIIVLCSAASITVSSLTGWTLPGWQI